MSDAYRHTWLDYCPICRDRKLQAAWEDPKARQMVGIAAAMRRLKVAEQTSARGEAL